MNAFDLLIEKYQKQFHDYIVKSELLNGNLSGLSLARPMALLSDVSAAS
jgi:hypothetical protein